MAVRDTFGNPIPNQAITSLKQDVSGLVGGKAIPIDVENSATDESNNALSVVFSGTTDDNGVLIFRVKSIAPGVFDERFRAILTYHNPLTQADIPMDMSIYTHLKNSFKKPFSGSMVLMDPSGQNANSAQEYSLQVKAHSSLSAYTIEDFSSSVKAKTAGQKVAYIGGLDNMSDNPNFFVRVESGGKTVNAPSLTLSPHPIIKLTQGGKTVRYDLTAQDAGADNTAIELNQEIASSGVKIIGLAKTQGNTTQSAALSAISPSAMRSGIRQNAYKLIAGMKTGQEQGGVKYVEGSVTIHGTPTYQTLVVKNGNVFIDGNLNTYAKKLGIIVLRDDTTKKELGNVYVLPAVSYIAGLIYADGGMISTGFKTGTDRVDSPYKNSSAREGALQNQLVLKGSVFTSNTVGGATPNDGSSFMLPGSVSTANFSTALMYDFNYLRRGNEGCDKNENGKCTDAGEYTNPFVIIYDTAAVRTPPKGFAQ